MLAAIQATLASGVQLHVFQDPQVNEFAKALDIRVLQHLVMVSVKDFLVADGPLGSEIQDMVDAIRSHNYFQAAKKVGPPALVVDIDVITATRGTLTPFANNRLVLKTRDVAR